MKIFVDTANLVEIEEVLKRGFVSGITTNPGLLAKEPKSGLVEHVSKIVELLKRYYTAVKLPLSVEVFSRDVEEIVRQAREFNKLYDCVAVKIQVGWNELEAINMLNREDISVNCTACMSVTQAIMAAAAGARYVSLFWGRIRDGKDTPAGDLNDKRVKAMEDNQLDGSDFDPATVVSLTRRLLDDSYPDTEIIVGSIRSVVDIRDAANAGAHIVTIPPKFFPGMVSHFKTDEVIDDFFAKFSKWIND